MKKIEAIIKRKTFTTIKTNLNVLGTYVIDKRNLDDSDIYDEAKGSRIGSTGLKSIPLAKIEIVVSDKDARKVVEMISYYKDEPKWMRDYRIASYEHFLTRPMPAWRTRPVARPP